MCRNQKDRIECNCNFIGKRIDNFSPIGHLMPEPCEIAVKKIGTIAASRSTTVQSR